MIGYIIVGAAAAVDGFALGVVAGRKWGSKLTVAAIKADGAAAEKRVEQVKAQVAPVVTQVEEVVMTAEDHAKTAAAAGAALEAHLAKQ